MSRGHWRLLEPGTTKAKAQGRVKKEKKSRPTRKFRVHSYKDPKYGFRVYCPEIWYPG